MCNNKRDSWNNVPKNWGMCLFTFYCHAPTHISMPEIDKERHLKMPVK